RDWVLRLLDESGCAGLLTEAV
ncbi:MAG: hypothetical protein RIS35_1338, partial [Pseudomonadota bacterium]